MAIQFCKYVVIGTTTTKNIVPTPTVSQLLVEVGLLSEPSGNIADVSQESTNSSNNSSTSISGTKSDAVGADMLLFERIPPAWSAWEESNAISSKELRSLASV